MYDRFRLSYLLLPVVVLLLSVPAVAQEKAENDDGRSPVLTRRLYDVSSLLSQPPRDYHSSYIRILRRLQRQKDYFDELLKWDVNLETETDRRILLHELLGQQVRSEEPWDHHGGAAMMTIVGGRLLVVWQTEEGHKQISELLDILQRRKAPTLGTRLMVVELDKSYQTRMLLKPMKPLKSEQEQQQLAAAITTVHQAVILTSRSGQTVSNARGIDHGYLFSVEPVVADGTTAHNVEVEMASSGFEYSVNVVLDPARNTADVAFETYLARVKEITPLDAKSNLPQMVTSYNDFQAGNLNVPVDAATIIASAAVPARLVNPEAAEDEKVQIYYVLVVSRMDEPATDDANEPVDAEAPGRP